MKRLFSLFLFSSIALRAQVPAALENVRKEKPPGECLYRSAEDFVPMTLSERLAGMAWSVAGPRPFLYSAIRAGVDQGLDRQKEWRQGARGFALRMGDAYAQHWISQVFEQSIALRLHEDNRYFVSGRKGIGHRLWYAAESTLLARHDNGSRHLSISALSGAAAAPFIASAWQPPSTTTAGDAAVSFGLTVGARFFVNALREFSPRRLAPAIR